VRFKGEDKLSVPQALKAAVQMAQADLAREQEAAWSPGYRAFRPGTLNRRYNFPTRSRATHPLRDEGPGCR
jgi:hypothetical protein